MENIYFFKIKDHRVNFSISRFYSFHYHYSLYYSFNQEQNAILTLKWQNNNNKIMKKKKN